MSPDRLNRRPIDIREPLPNPPQIEAIVSKYEVNLLSKAWNTWSDEILQNGQKREWLVCGPATIAMTRLLNWETGIPILSKGNPYTQAHLKLSPHYFYNPGSNTTDAMEHTFATYFNGQGTATHIDVTGLLLHRDKKRLTGEDNLHGAIHMRTFSTVEYSEALRSKYHLQPHEPDNPILKDVYKRLNLEIPSLSKVEAWSAAIHSNQITSPFPFKGIEDEDENYVTTRFGTGLADFIRTMIPDWDGIK
jgi:hypothetical protein